MAWAPATSVPVLIVRHDVDQHAGSALAMSDVEVALGLRSTWYFRWRTASRPVIAEIRRRGGEVGLHYETLSRNALLGHEATSDAGAGGGANGAAGGDRRVRRALRS